MRERSNSKKLAITYSLSISIAALTVSQLTACGPKKFSKPGLSPSSAVEHQHGPGAPSAATSGSTRDKSVVSATGIPAEISAYNEKTKEIFAIADASGKITFSKLSSADEHKMAAYAELNRHMKNLLIGNSYIYKNSSGEIISAVFPDDLFQKREDFFRSITQQTADGKKSAQIPSEIGATVVAKETPLVTSKDTPYTYDQKSTMALIKKTLESMKNSGELSYDTAKLAGSIRETATKTYTGKNVDAFVSETTAYVTNHLDDYFVGVVSKHLVKFASQAKSLKWFKDSDEDKAVLDYVKDQYGADISDLVMAKVTLPKVDGKFQVSRFMVPELRETDLNVKMPIPATEIASAGKNTPDVIQIEGKMNATGISTLLYVATEKAFGSHYLLLVDDSPRTTESESVIAHQMRRYMDYKADRNNLSVATIQAEMAQAGSDLAKVADADLTAMLKSSAIQPFVDECRAAKISDSETTQNYHDYFMNFVSIYPELGAKHAMAAFAEEVRFLKAAATTASTGTRTTSNSVDSIKSSVKNTFYTKLMGFGQPVNGMHPPVPNFIDEWFENLYKAASQAVASSG